MKKHTFSILALTICAIFSVRTYLAHNPQLWEADEGMEEDLAGRLIWMNKMLADPATGRIPDAYRQQELEFAATLPADNMLGKFASWQSVGPWNVGGRTRALAIDMNDDRILLAGAATGGIWRSTNGGISWYLTNMSAVPTANITSLVQDKRNGKSKNWYAASGELYGGSLPGAFYNGSGVYKSTDGGDTWVKAGNVTSGLGGVSGAWSVIHRLALNPVIDSVDVVFAANFDGIYRSINAGLSWVKVRGGGSQATSFSYFTDVAITSSGIVYATLSGGGQQQGIWRSADNGKTWANITPPWFNGAVERVSIGIAPSDEKQVYFLANTPGQGKESKNFEGTSEYNSLWKYTYVSGDGTQQGGIWDDRSMNIPGGLGGFNDFISQGSYCLEVNVKPNDTNVVFIGGTNLYRSTDGFKTAQNTSYVGGYAQGTTLPDFKTYKNHHPDNHGVVFYPSNPNRMISIHDGGISYTDNGMAPVISWESLNHGYITSQFYTIAQNPTGTDNLIAGGLQDNGTKLTSSASYTDGWTMPLSYDGSFTFIKPGGGEAYFSIQQGRMQRMLLDQNGFPTQMTRIDPLGVNKAAYQFINPFTPDAHDFKILFTPAGNVIWRNSNITAIPLKNELDSNASSINWTMLPHTLLPVSGDEITAIYSSSLQQDVLFYGTMKGKLYRLRNTADTASVPEAITGTNFPSGYINCIVQHPTDSQQIFAVFTNYGILSVFQSKDGGQSWAAISGNLEQNASGGGNGPSCRWLTIAPVQDSLVYFLGTSTGLYATKQLDGMNTVWSRQGANTIGNQIVTMMHHRTTDGRMVVATYGSGVFKANVQSLDPKTAISNVKGITSLQIYPNPAVDMVYVKGLKSQDYYFELMDEQGKIIMKGNRNLSDPIQISAYPSGKYFLLILSDACNETKIIIKP